MISLINLISYKRHTIFTLYFIVFFFFEKVFLQFTWFCYTSFKSSKFCLAKLWLFCYFPLTRNIDMFKNKAKAKRRKICEELVGMASVSRQRIGDNICQGNPMKRLVRLYLLLFFFHNFSEKVRNTYLFDHSSPFFPQKYNSLLTINTFCIQIHTKVKVSENVLVI